MNKSGVVPFWLVIPAAGVGSRVGGDLPKQYQLLAGRTLLEQTLDVFLQIPGLNGVVMVLHPEDERFQQLPCAAHPLVMTACGGGTRAESVANGLDALSDRSTADDWVLVHDAARPCVRSEDVMNMLDTLSHSAVGGIMAVPVSDTLKRVQTEAIERTQDREQLWQAQTPQMFRYGLLRDALASATQAGQVVTDESSALELLGHQPLIFEGRRSNLKITHPEDWALAESILNQTGAINGINKAMTANQLRIGHGYDVHRFAEPSDDAAVILGGVKIPYSKNLLAHSDGDVLIHALCDALLGAASLGDIGQHFPDTDDAFKNIDSRQLLKQVAQKLSEKSLSLGNADITLVAQAPKMLPHIEAMRRNLASDLAVDVAQINIKATTTEKLGFEGREEGIACHASVILEPSLSR